MSFLEDHVSGLLHFALAVDSGTAMTAFREAFTKFMYSHPFEVLHGPPPVDVVQYQNFILDLFGRTGARQAEKNYPLRTLAIGDWRLKDRFQIYLPVGVLVDYEELRKTVTQGLLLALTSKVFSKYPRHRCLGCEEATDEIALLDCIHGLGTATFGTMFSSSTSTDPEPFSISVSGTSLGSSAGRGSRSMLPPALQDDTGSALAQDDPPTQPASHMEPKDYAALNARYAKMSKTWLDSEPMGKVMVMRLCMRPLAQLLLDYIKRSGHQWEQQVRAHAAGQADAVQSRIAMQSRLMAHVNHTSEDVFLQELEKLLQSNHWSFIPATDHTMEVQATGFKMTSRMGGLVKQMLLQPLDLCPLKLFQVVSRGAEAATEIQQLPVCMTDPFTQGFLRQFPGPWLRGPDAAACLQAMAKQCRWSGAMVESTT